MSLDKVMMPVPDGHPDVFDREWPLRVADIDREGRLRFDAAARHIQDIGQDQLREMGFKETHPLWIVRRTMVDLIRPIEFGDMLRMRRWCSGTSNRWCEMRVRIDGRKGGLDGVRGVLDQLQPRHPDAGAHRRRLPRGPAADHRHRPAAVEGLSESRAVVDDAAEIHEFPVRVTDIDLFDHMNNSVYWSVIEDYLASYPELLKAPLRVTIEHDAAVALGDKLEIISHVHPAGSTDRFGADLADRTVRTLTYAVGDETKAVASIFAL